MNKSPSGREPSTFHTHVGCLSAIPSRDNSQQMSTVVISPPEVSLRLSDISFVSVPETSAYGIIKVTVFAPILLYSAWECPSAVSSRFVSRGSPAHYPMAATDSVTDLDRRNSSSTT